MNLNHLQYFLETCRYGSITKASEVCHISQPSITAAINNLEKELGAKLFDRVNNRLRLTVVGEGFKDLTEEFLKTFDDYCQSAYDIASSRYTKIRVGIPPFLSTIITKKLFPEFSVQHPNIRLEIVEVGLIDGLNKLNSSQLDCLIGVCRSKTFTCNSRCLFTTKLTLAVNRGSELVHRHKAISIAQMESIPLVTPVKGSYLYSLINEILASEKPNIVMQSNQLTTLKYMLRVDCAAAIIYDGLFNDDEDMRSSYEWLLLFRKQYPYLIWLNPETIPEKASYWTQTQVELADIFQMFHLSANGLEAGMKCLLVRQ